MHLFGQLPELKKYKVKNIIANKLILAESLDTGNLVVFKTLHKSPAVYKKSKTSLLPINITYMVKLLKYFETDDCVYLMLEYCSAGLLWDMVRPLVGQNSSSKSEINSEIPQINRTPVKSHTSIIKPSESFLIDRKVSINLSNSEEKPSCDSTQSDNDEDDMMIVHQTNPNSVVIVNRDKIEHFENINDSLNESGQTVECQSNIVENSQKMIDQISAKIDKNDSDVKNVLDKLDHIESKIKNMDQPPSTVTERSKSVEKVKFSDVDTKSTGVASGRPKVLRKLSEILPRSDLLDDFGDPTELPDKLVRTWAAELCQVLSSLHYREIIVRDLNPGNILLDKTGHVKLTYQCQWVSVDTCLTRAAVRDNFCAPEVVGLGAASDITPAADWWSFGKMKGWGNESLLYFDVVILMLHYSFIYSRSNPTPVVQWSEPSFSASLWC